MASTSVGPDLEKVSSSPNETSSPVPEETEEKRQLTGPRWAIFVVSTLTAIFVYSLDNTIVANLVPIIVNELDGVEKLAWLSVGFMIGGMATILPFGKLYAIYDSKWVYICSTIVFLAASALCGAAPTIEAEIAGRVFAGAGGNGMYYGLLALLSIHTTSRERPQYLSLTGAVWGLGSVLGPVVGGGFSLYNWRWGFYINLLFGAILLPTYLFVIPSANPMPEKSQAQKIALLDWTGIIISIGAMITLVMAINLGGVEFAWDSGASIALFVLTGILWFVFGVQQSFCIWTDKKKRLFPVHLLSHKMPVLLFIACASAATVSYVSVNYIPLYFQFTRGDSALFTAVRLLPFITLLITFIPLSGFVMTKWGWFKPWYLGGSAVSLVTGALMAHYVTRTTPVEKFYVIELFLAAGAGAYTQSSFAVIQSVLSPDEASNGLALMMIAQLSGMALGLSISGSVFVNTAIKGLARILPTVPHNELSQFVSGASNKIIGTLSPEMRALALNEIVAAWQKTFICVYVGAAVALLASILMKNTKANISVAAGGG